MAPQDTQPPASPPLPPPISSTPQQAQPGQTPASPQHTEPLRSEPQPPAEDSDVIEMQWVDRVEGLVRQHAQDPYEMARQFSELKIQYIAKRYGKVLGGEAKERHNG